MDKVFFDIECYKNYFLIMFRDRTTRYINYIQLHNGETTGTIESKRKLKEYMRNITSVGFNSDHYDMVMVSAYLKGYDNTQLKKLSDHIINEQSPNWLTYKKFNLRKVHFDHIDLKEPAPGVMTSLKIYGGRANAPKLQDLPIEPDAIISEKDAKELRSYCVNDLDTTEILFNEIYPDIKLRDKVGDKYGIDLRSKSGAQMAESIFRVYLEAEGIEVTKRKSKVKPFKYTMPDWVNFESDIFNDMKSRIENAVFSINDSGKPILPKEISNVIHWGDLKLKFGIGGIHSQEKKQGIVCPDGYLFSEKDVNSLYPSIIIEQGIYPEHLTSKFLDIYKDIYRDRFYSKDKLGELISTGGCPDEIAHHKLIVDTNKLSLNSSYGKLGSRYSFLYSPELVIQTTITGQLSILMLIEKLTKVGAKITSANTDSVDVLRPIGIEPEIDVACLEWELETGYRLDDTPYLSKYSESVNSYVAVKTKGVKGKGTFASDSLMKSPNRPVCSDAIKSFLSSGNPIRDHILNEKDITRFLTVRNVTGGAVYKGELLGKAVRFYHSTNGDMLTYKNGNKVPTSDNCKPLMDLPDAFPQDVDHDWYINECYSLLDKIGYKGD